MVKKRVGYKVIVSKEAQQRLDKGECPSCGKPKEDWMRRKDWACCSSACTKKFQENMKLYGWADLRAKVIKRDGYKCVKCGFQPLKKRYMVGGWLADTENNFKLYYKKSTFCKGFGKELVSGRNTLFAKMIDTSRLIGDHIMPIACGGEEFDINNVQTLCEACNKLKTKEDQGEIAKMRNIERVLTKGQIKIWDLVER